MSLFDDGSEYEQNDDAAPIKTQNNPSTMGGLLGTAVQTGLPLLGQLGASLIGQNDRHTQQQIAQSKSNMVLWIVGGIAAVVAIIAIIWVIKKRG